MSLQVAASGGFILINIIKTKLLSLCDFRLPPRSSEICAVMSIVRLMALEECRSQTYLILHSLRIRRGKSATPFTFSTKILLQLLPLFIILTTRTYFITRLGPTIFRFYCVHLHRVAYTYHWNLLLIFTVLYVLLNTAQSLRSPELFIVVTPFNNFRNGTELEKILNAEKLRLCLQIL